MQAYLTTPGIPQEDDCIATVRRQLQEVSGEALPVFFINSADLRLALLIIAYPILICSILVSLLIFFRSWKVRRVHNCYLSIARWAL